MKFGVGMVFCAWLSFGELGAQGLPGLPETPLPSLPEPECFLPLRPMPMEEAQSKVQVAFRGEELIQDANELIVVKGAMEGHGVLLLADRIVYDRKSQVLEAKGNIRMEGKDMRLRCERLRMDWKTRSGEAWLLTLELPPSWTLKSDHVSFLDELKFWHFKDVVLSACPEEKPGWSARLSEMKLHRERYATFKHARIWVKGVPAYYWPWAAYPAKAERSSGFLLPSVGRDSEYGLKVGIPYYQTLGESADLTVTPTWYSRQGVLWNGEMRWALEPTHQGSFTGSFIKQRLDGETRHQYQLKELWQREDGWQLSMDINQASDALLGVDYGSGLAGLGGQAFDSSLFIGKSYGWGALSLAASEQKSFFQDQDPFYTPEFPTSMARRTLPQGQLRFFPVSMGRFYLDGGLRYGRMAYDLELKEGKSRYDWQRGDANIRAYGRLGQVGPFRADLQLGGRFTTYSASLQEAIFDPKGEEGALGYNSPFKVDGPALNRLIGSSRLQFSGPQVGRGFEGLRLMGYAGDVKHVVEPFMAFTANTRSTQGYQVPRFDELDSRPGLQNSADGERSLELGLKQHLFGRPGAGHAYADLVRWRISTRFHFDPILLPDGRRKEGWASIDNDIDVEPNRRVRLSFRRSSEIGSSGADNSLSADYISKKGSQVGLAFFSTGVNRFVMRQRGLQLGGIMRLKDDTWRLQYQVNYDIQRKEFASSQVALAYVTPCISTRFSYRHVAIPVALNSNRTKEDRFEVVMTLKVIGDYFYKPSF